MYYINTYNASVDSSYASTFVKSKVNFRLGFSGGITNNPFVINPDNVKVPLVGLEIELYEAKVKSAHSGFLQARHTFDDDDFPYSTTEFSLGYRYRIINKSWFSIYAQVKLITLHFTDITSIDENNNEVRLNNTSFELPLILGVGSDIKVGKNSFITIIYGELYGVFLDNQGNSSADIALGYKFNL